ncbi:hypothetical protein JAO29_14815 [Edaphobacter sp. HDX4]|uniref:hypothetical protein n=1 Tax=Edaphobacter sp. HDX4 TaxID=2794064 RepID=UPI002FE6A7B2
MKSGNRLTTAILTLALGVTTMQAADPSQPASSPKDAQLTLEKIPDQACGIADVAFRMKNFGQTGEKSDLQVEDLRHLKEKVNTIGKRWRFLKNNAPACRITNLQSSIVFCQKWNPSLLTHRLRLQPSTATAIISLPVIT